MKVVPLNRAFATDICTWRYPAPYNCSDMTDADPEALLAPESGFFALLRDGELIGFRSFGATVTSLAGSTTTHPSTQAAVYVQN